ncbi:N-acetylglucosamine-induced protein 1 [Beauveria bassiana]|uniref:N-acetylglucosamine-induced protein 1 n=1 Tax=Beauveria bassiana (strain ARSEF 2860) TaxID=655819 RepID=J4WH81_BEAB2|nr:Protein of unknown function DUF3605 [Beauveria bassiana ARSEF 2860]EJP69230.1 Protein of unknown function DUF3605 [Beauveria bassiana ARSEF 2860]KAF1738685.1 N-acetylglucosamine-induced protein 1 [Beauveria bassiana]KAH8720833.1 N-acetylglucosamine-induced protein 1 [Beauveria bassiana]
MATCQKMGDSSINGDSVPSKPAFNLTNVDKWILQQPDETFKKHDWEDLRRIIESNQLQDLKRTPTELRKYLEWTAGIKEEYGSMTDYLMKNRLPSAWGQPPFTPASTVPMADASDYAILLNDWPYALAPGITHVIVWTRTRIPADDDRGDMLPESRRLVGDFVRRTFADALGPGGEDRVLWFKNWVALQSVRALEHFHVLVKDVDHDMLEKWTGERPKAKRPWEE